MGRTRMGRTDGRTDGLTDGRTDGQGDDYMLPRNFSGSIKICAYWKDSHATNTDLSVMVYGIQRPCYHVAMVNGLVTFPSLSPGVGRLTKPVKVINNTLMVIVMHCSYCKNVNGRHLS